VTACLAVLLGLATGCSSDKPTGTMPPAPPLVGPGGVTSPQDVLAKLPGGDEFAAGKKVYADNKCANCHKLGDTGGGGGGMMAGGLLAPAPGATGTPVAGGPMAAPDLTKVGAMPERTRQWLTEHIRDAKKHKPQSRMPAFPTDKISDADLDKLVEYLASRK
jgi:mono/diheme cytochrome c family protein